MSAIGVCPSFTKLLLFIIVMLFGPLLLQAQTTETLDDPKTLDALLKNQKFKCHGTGALAVFGTFRYTTGGEGVYPATVKLNVNKVGITAISTEEDGSYCIRYNPGATITSLIFQQSGATCVEEISGDRSHYINKLLDQKCSKTPLQTRSAPLTAEEAKTVFGNRIAKFYLPVQLNITNDAGEDVKVLSAYFSHNSPSGNAATAQSGVVPDVQPIDPRLLGIPNRRPEVASLLRIGPFALAAILRSDFGTFPIENVVFHPNDVVPDKASAVKVVFVPKSRLTTGNYNTATEFLKVVSELGDVTLVARGVSSGDEYRFPDSRASGQDAQTGKK